MWLKRKNRNKQINKKIKESNLLDTFYIWGNNKEIIKRNFLAGIFRGIGIGIGFTLITAIIVALLNKIIKLNIPIIGEYVSDIVEIVKNKGI